jgi:hypothetical protein
MARWRLHSIPTSNPTLLSTLFVKAHLQLGLRAFVGGVQACKGLASVSQLLCNLLCSFKLLRHVRLHTPRALIHKYTVKRGKVALLAMHSACVRV